MSKYYMVGNLVQWLIFKTSSPSGYAYIRLAVRSISRPSLHCQGVHEYGFLRRCYFFHKFNTFSPIQEHRKQTPDNEIFIGNKEIIKHKI